MITELLPAYQTAHGNTTQYRILESMNVDGHEVAWIEASGTVHDWTDRRLYCQCHFERGTGWDIYEDGRVYGLHFNCPFQAKALNIRQAELRTEYQRRFKKLEEHVPEIILDLIEKAKAGDFIGETGVGAHFWGGYFYTQLVYAITECPVWQAVAILRQRKLIDLDGNVIQPYTEPAPPNWVEYNRIEKDGWKGIAFLPEHSKMPQEWRFRVIAPDGQAAYDKPEGLQLNYDPIFGPDAEDVAAAQVHLTRLMAAAMK